MICPSCKMGRARVRETRTVGSVAWRRRICAVCEYRFTTYELSGDKIVEAISRAMSMSDVKVMVMRVFLAIMREVDDSVKE